MITINIEDLVQETGLYGPLWDMDMETCSKYVSHHSWIFHTCLYNFTHKVKLQQSHSCLTPRRINDHSIMAIAINTYSDKATLRSINKVRMLHNVYHLSDITCADGRSINKLCWAPRASNNVRNDHIWPSKHHVTQRDFTCWRKFLRSIYTIDSLRLPTPLLD